MTYIVIDKSGINQLQPEFFSGKINGTGFKTAWFSFIFYLLYNVNIRCFLESYSCPTNIQDEF